ncbi:uncharacterized protein LOC129739328 isoform X2 [Uranotaenia lowii]|uniref:uncharacterized protein LOC129739328 isoform X2 n=1 Tax=Uranotaenia lowii TaxID=190385 RepID=UPI0024798DFB|nr:uncharacterized protein LOC129739328 isoform X2 [Uranotaenia lowii]
MGPKKGTLQGSSKEKRPRSYPVSGDKPAASKPTFLESDQDPDPGSENDPDELRSDKVAERTAMQVGSYNILKIRKASQMATIKKYIANKISNLRKVRRPLDGN